MGTDTMIDRDIFFDAVRDELFEGALTQQQVDGMGVILGMWEGGHTGTPMDDIRWLAYMLATVYHECATTMWPITEYGSQSYLQGKDYYPYIGRGFVMITWEENYRNASAKLGLVDSRDLVEHPEMALDSLIAARILFRGMAEGWFTGRKLGQYFNDEKDDPVNARQIVNGNDDDDLIAGYHDKFLAALDAASSGAEPARGEALIAVTVPEGISVTVLVNGIER
jgi:putative chitinase